MRVKLNTEFVRRPPLENVDVYDTKYPSLVLRCRASGMHTYRVNYGRGKWVTLGRADTLTVEEARMKARDELSKIDKGHDPKAARIAAKSDITFGRYHRGTLRALDAGAPAAHDPDRTPEEPRLCRVPGMKLSAFTGFQIERWRSARLKDDKTAGTCNRDLSALKAALSRAVKWHLLKRNPLSDVKALRVDTSSIVRYLTQEEEKRLRAALDGAR